MFENIRLISFDLDDTLWPTQPVIMAAEHELHQWLKLNAPDMASALSVFDMRDQRLEFMQEYPQLAHNLTLVRVKTLEAALGAYGYSSSLAAQAMAVFRNARNRVTPWEDVRPLLEELGQRYILVSLTNGNAEVERTPLRGCFHYSLSAEDIGCAKPDPGMFHQLASLSGCTFEQMLHVGDDWERDMLPAMRLGMATAWVHRYPKGGVHKQGADLCLFNLNPLRVYL